MLFKLLLFIEIIFFLPAISWANTNTAASCSYSDVSTTIGVSLPGDTVIVPAGACTWSSKLTITKGVQLIGDGAGNTVITSGYSNTSDWLITYEPSNYSLNTPFRLSGFTFDLADKSGWLELGSNILPTTIQTNIRIDHNMVVNGSTTQGGVYITHRTCFGVVDSNTFGVTRYPFKADPLSATWWNTYTYDPGQTDSLYFEDNSITIGDAPYPIVTDCQYSGRFSYRYNDITVTSGENWPLFDMHGNQHDGCGTLNDLDACYGGELYGNQVTASNPVRLLDQRGGQAFVFFNNSSTSSTWEIQIREECADSSPGPATDPDGDTQHVQKSYYWTNLKYGGTSYTVKEGQHVGDIPLIGRDFSSATTWNESGGSVSSGVGCGTVSAMNAITSCSEGVGFWATDQSCTNLTDYAGANPTTPIAGTLYKCGASNNWIAYYTPLSYPHPLRGTTSLPAPDLNTVGIP